MNYVKNIRKSGYFKETFVDVGVSLIVYHFFGFEVTVVVLLAMLMVDIATIMKKLYEEN